MKKSPKKDVKKSNENKDIEVVVGDDSELYISEVSDCINDLRPKSSSSKKNIIIPTEKKKKKKK